MNKNEDKLNNEQKVQMKSTQNEGDSKNEDNLKNKDNTKNEDIFMKRRLYIDKAHTALDIFRFAVFFLNGSEFRQKLIGTIFRVLVRHLHALHSPASNNEKDPYEVKCHIRAQCGGGGQFDPHLFNSF